jgi:hypothetical protein
MLVDEQKATFLSALQLINQPPDRLRVASICLRLGPAVLAAYGVRRQVGGQIAFKVMVKDNDVVIGGGFNAFTEAEGDYH